jgi:PAS domain S-box-containing protein
MESREMYRQLFENSKEAVFIVRPDGLLLDINPAGLELFGYSSMEEKPDFNIARDAYADPSVRKDVLQRLSENGYVKDFRLEVKRKDGKRLTVLATISVFRDEKGEVVAHQGILYDVTERVRAEEALRQSEERFKRMVLNSNDIFSLIDENGKHTTLSGPIERILGYTPEEAEGNHFSDYWHPDDVKTAGKRSWTSSAIPAPAGRWNTASGTRTGTG